MSRVGLLVSSATSLCDAEPLPSSRTASGAGPDQAEPHVDILEPVADAVSDTTLRDFLLFAVLPGGSLFVAVRVALAMMFDVPLRHHRLGDEQTEPRD